jgi:hypothetical protein
MGDEPVARALSTHRTTQTQNKRTQTSMPLVGFEPTSQDGSCLRPRDHCDRRINGMDCRNVKTVVIGEYFELLDSVYFVSEDQRTQPQIIRLIGGHLVTERNVSLLLSGEVYCDCFQLEKEVRYFFNISRKYFLYIAAWLGTYCYCVKFSVLM